MRSTAVWECVCVRGVCVCVYTGVRLANPQATCPRLGLPASPASRRRPPAHRETCCRPCRSAATPGTAAPPAAAPRPSPQHRCAPRRPLRGVPSTAAGSHGFPSQPQQQRSGCSWAAGRVLALGMRSRPARHGARGACAGRPRTVATQQGGELPWRLHRAAAVWEPAAGEAREDPVHHHQRLRQRAPRLVKPAQGHKHAALAQAAQLGPRGSGVGTVGADAEHDCIRGAGGKEGGGSGSGSSPAMARKEAGSRPDEEQWRPEGGADREGGTVSVGPEAPAAADLWRLPPEGLLGQEKPAPRRRCAAWCLRSRQANGKASPRNRSRLWCICKWSWDCTPTAGQAAPPR